MEEIFFPRLIGQVQNCDETHKLGAENGFKILQPFRCPSMQLETLTVFDEDHQRNGLLILHSNTILRRFMS
jgi:hypothetical protein